MNLFNFLERIERPRNLSSSCSKIAESALHSDKSKSFILGVGLNRSRLETSIVIHLLVARQQKINTITTDLINIQEDYMTFATEKEILDTIEVEAAKNGLTSHAIKEAYGATAWLFEHIENILRFKQIVNKGRSYLPDKPVLPREVVEEKIKKCILKLELKTRKNGKTCCRYVCYVMIKHRFWKESASYCLNKLKDILKKENVEKIIGSEKTFEDSFSPSDLKNLPYQNRKSYEPYKKIVDELEEELKAEGLVEAA